MNFVGALVLVLASVLMLTLPRRLAILPLLLAVTYMTRGQELEIGAAHFTIPRLLVVVDSCGYSPAESICRTACTQSTNCC